MCIYICVCVTIYAHVCRCQWFPEGRFRSLGAGVAGICEPPDTGTGIQTLVQMMEQPVLFSSEPPLQPFTLVSLIPDTHPL